MNKKQTLSLAIVLFASIILSMNSFAQISPFSKVINNSPDNGIQTYASCQNNLGSTILVGEGLFGKGLILMIDKNGELQWNKTWNILNTNGSPVFTSIINTIDDGYFLSGHFYQNEETNTIYTKLDMNGDTVWTKANTLSSVYSSIQTSDNGFMMIGKMAVPSPIFSQLSILKVDVNGEYEWSKSLTVNNKPCRGYSIKQKVNGNYLIVGSYEEEDNNKNIGLLTELSSTGDVLWTKTYFDEINNRNSGAHDFQIINDSLYILLNGWSSIVVRTDISGNLDWAKKINGTSGWGDMAYNMRKLIKTPDNHLLFISGYEFSDYTKIDRNANIIFSGYMEINATDIYSTEDNGILVLGNGPLLGVKTSMLDILRNNIGVIQMDETGYGVECIESSSNSSSLIEMTTNTIVFQEHSGGQPTSAQFEMGTLELTTENGCVDFTGGIDEPSEIQSATYPNPNSGHFTLELSQYVDGKLSILNNLGQVVLQEEINAQFVNINMEAHPSGVYFYKVELNRQFISFGKFIIQK